jgi:hypothetical protein
MQEGGRNKGPIPRAYRWSYRGPEQRLLEKKARAD